MKVWRRAPITAVRASPPGRPPHPTENCQPGSAKPGRARRAARLAALVLLGSIAALAGLVSFTAFRHPVPWERLDSAPVSPIVTDRAGHLLLARVASDDQWHRPVPIEQVSPFVVRATLSVEDERFRHHPGVDPIAVLRALSQNLAARRVVSGASTITMQLARLLDDRPRTLGAKLIETTRALALERRLSKDEILEHYLNRAPYGANVRGIEAAAWFWFDRSASELSLGQAALLAGLPQAPSRLRPDRHPDRALARRDKVLRRLRERGEIDLATERRARREPLGLRLPSGSIRAPHAAWLALTRRPEGGRTTIDLERQRALEEMLAGARIDRPRGSDWAAAVVEIATGDLIALVGSADVGDPVDGQVNGATALRSPGSTLKPFVYATAFEAKRLAPSSIVDDVPISRDGWRPSNFDRQHRGRVDVATALRSSLNVPAIHVAEQIGLARCLGTLRRCGIRFAGDPFSRGGLALVTGAVETTLLDLVEAYATIGRSGRHRPIRLFLDEPTFEERALSTTVCRHLDQILSSRARRPRGLEALAESEVPWFMWKTGTSSGRRDAWAVGHNGEYAAGIWVGSFGGAGHSTFVGSEAAEPLLAALFAHPLFWRFGEPPEPPPLEVECQLAPPIERRPGLRIVTPRDGEVFLSPTGEPVALRCEAAGAGEVIWFRDGERVELDASARLRISRGKHRLQAITPEGGEVSVSVVVE